MNASKAKAVMLSIIYAKNYPDFGPLIFPRIGEL